MLSVNQINAQIKLVEIWKSLNIKNYPLTVTKKSISDTQPTTRSLTSGKLVEVGGVCGLTSKTCVSDAVRLWNIAPEKVTQATSIHTAKKEIKTFVKTFPI